MIRKAVLAASLSLLTSCATPSVPPIETPAPKAPDPRICVAVKPEPQVEGSVVAPATEAERAALRAFLNGEAGARGWGRDGWAIALLAQKHLCGPPLKPPRPG